MTAARRYALPAPIAGADDSFATQFCLALVYDRLRRHADAETELQNGPRRVMQGPTRRLKSIRSWGNSPKVLEWLDTAMRRRDRDLVNLKTDPLMDPLRHESRFQAIERELQFPD